MSLRGNEVIAVAESEGFLLCIERDGERGPFSRSKEFVLGLIAGLVCTFGLDFSFDLVRFMVSRPFELPEASEWDILDVCSIESLKGELTKLRGLDRRRS
jgi:hypothetical protein